MKEARIVLALLVVFSLVLMLNGSVSAQTPTAKIVVKGVTPKMLADLPSPKPFTSVSSGLQNVGKGQNVWLEAQGILGTGTSKKLDTLVSATWTILQKPAGSLAEIIYTDTAGGLQGLTAGFVPDMIGQYEVGLTVTNIHALTSAQSTAWVNAGTWVGVGGIVGTANYPECGSCHSDKVTDWQTTNHSTAFQRKLDDGTGHFAGYCISCHAVGYDALPTADNDGFDDAATAAGWVFPGVLQQGNWDSMKTNYPTVAAKANVQCESCHGPGSEHGGAVDNSKIVTSLSADGCTQCHDAFPYHRIAAQWGNSVHARSVVEGASIEGLNRSSCTRCHTGNGFVEETIKGNAAPTNGYADVQSITCAACHDPHSGDHEAQLRRQTVADACTGCHTTRVSSRGLHHSHQGQVLLGADGVPYAGQTGVGDWTGWELAGYTYLNSGHSDIADKCVTCHMAAPPADSLLSEHLGGHSFAIAYDNGTPDDEADDVINPNGCVDCHGTVTLDFVRLSQEKIKDLLEELRVILPHATTGDTTQPKGFTDASLTKIQKAASYNYFFILNDGSFGVHNEKYAEGLLRASIDQVQLGAGGADIVTVKDVPNDQGKQVLVVWDQFPAEKFSIEPVLSYGVWRKDVGVTPAAAVKVKNIREMFSKPAAGGQYSLYGDVWTFIGTVPKANLAQYSFVAPTLYDSTIADGAKWTTYYVTGHTESPIVMYASAPDSGYSLDNLAPAPPLGLAAHIATSTVQLTWTKSNDADFKYFAVYRGTSSNFDPTGTEPIAKISETAFDDNGVTEGNTYYYKLTAYDFSGNVSGFSNELEVLVLGVDEGRGVPTEFALKQNYPNPFNPSTTLKYQLPSATHVRVTVYNTLGVEIATLVNGIQDAGYFSITWDGRDNSGKSVSSGFS